MGGGILGGKGNESVLRGRVRGVEGATDTEEVEGAFVESRRSIEKFDEVMTGSGLENTPDDEEDGDEAGVSESEKAADGQLGTKPRELLIKPGGRNAIAIWRWKLRKQSSIAPRLWLGERIV